MLENVVVGADETETGQTAVRRALDLLRGSGGTLHIVNGYKPRQRAKEDLPPELRYSVSVDSESEVLLRQLALLAKDEEISVVTHPVTADPVTAITAVANEEHADLIVVAHRRMHRPRGRSSVSKALARIAPCAVMIIPVN